MIEKKEFKNLDVTALRQEVISLKKELFNLRLNQLTGQVKDFSQFSKLKKQVARAQTFLKQKQLRNNDVAGNGVKA